MTSRESLKILIERKQSEIQLKEMEIKLLSYEVDMLWSMFETKNNIPEDEKNEMLLLLKEILERMK